MKNTLLLLAVVFFASCSKKETSTGVSTNTNLPQNTYSIDGKISYMSYSKIARYTGYTFIYLGKVYQEDNIIIQIDSAENKFRIKGNLGVNLAPTYDEYDGVSQPAVLVVNNNHLVIKGRFKKTFDIEINATVK